MNERVRRRIQHVGSAKFQDMFSYEIYIVIRAPNTTGGSRVITKVTEDSIAFIVTWS